MRSLTRGTRATTIATTATGVAGQASLLITGIIAARLLGVEDRGNLALLYLLVIVTSQLASLGLPLAVTYEIASDLSRTRAVTRVAGRLCAWQILVGTVLNAALVLLLLEDPTTDVRIAGAISVLNCGATIVLQFSLAILQGLRRFTPFNVFRVVPQLGYAILATGAVLASADTVTAVTIAWTTATLLGALGAAIAAIHQLRILPANGEPSAVPTPRRLLSFGARGLLGSSSPVETFRVDQALVGLALSPAALGLYVTAISLTNLPKFLAQSLGMVAYPQVAAQPSARLARTAMWRFVAVSVVVCGVATLALALLVPWVLPLFFGEEFRPAIPLAEILLLGAAFVSVRRVMSDCARGIGLPGAGSAAEVVSWFVLAPALIAASTIGVEAVAWAVVASSVVSLVALLWLVLRKSNRSTHAAALDQPNVIS